MPDLLQIPWLKRWGNPSPLPLVSSEAIDSGKGSRRLVPVAIGVPLSLGWLIYQGQQIGWYESRFGLMVLSGSLVVLSLGLVKRGAALLDRTNRNHQQTETILRQSEARFQRLSANLPGMIYQSVRYADGTDAFTYLSDRSREIYEYEPEVLLQDFGVVWRNDSPQ